MPKWLVWKPHDQHISCWLRCWLRFRWFQSPVWTDHSAVTAGWWWRGLVLSRQLDKQTFIPSGADELDCQCVSCLPLCCSHEPSAESVSRTDPGYCTSADKIAKIAFWGLCGLADVVLLTGDRLERRRKRKNEKKDGQGKENVNKKRWRRRKRKRLRRRGGGER